MAATTPKKDTTLYAFETDELTGAFGGAGYYHGVRRLRRKAEGRDIVRADLFALSFYRALVAGKELGGLRELAQVVDRTDTRLELAFEPCDWHPAAIRAVYEIVSPTAVDLDITVEAQAPLADYQLYISSYFDWAFQPYVYAYRGTPYEAGRRPGIVRVAETDLTRGYYMLFPRDVAAVHRRTDGRWDCGPNGPVVSTVGPYFAEPLAFMYDPGTTTACAIMARAADCDTILTTYAIEESPDPVSAHNAIYLTMACGDLEPGRSWSTTVRLEVVKVKSGFGQVLQRAQAFAEKA